MAFTPQLGPVLKDADVTTGYDLLHGRPKTTRNWPELARLFYVATTRAADYLILSAGVEQARAARRAVDGNARPAVRSAHRPAVARGSVCLRARCRIRAGGRLRQSDYRGTAGPFEAGRSAGETQLASDCGKGQADGRRGAGKTPRRFGAIPCDAGARRQFSFSRLTGTLHVATVGAAADSIARPPAGPPRLDPLGLGTLVHAVLEEVDFSRPADLAEAVRRLAEEHLPGAGDRLGEPIEMLDRFLASPRAAAVTAAAEAHPRVGVSLGLAAAG